MNSYEALIEKLDWIHYFCDQRTDDVSTETAQIACDCKAAVEALLSEVDALRAKNAELRAALARVKAERDAKDRQMHGIIQRMGCR